jgi:hypothetical protein
LEVTFMSRVGSGKWWALGAVSLSILAVSFDGTVLSVALPTLARALHASESDLEWFSSGYLMLLAAGVLPAGLIGDRYGRKKVMLASLAAFGAVRLRTVRRCVPDCPAAHGTGRGRDHGHGHVRADRPVRGGGAAKGGRDLRGG